MISVRTIGADKTSWTISLYWPVTTLLAAWALSVTLLSTLGSEIASILVSGTIVSGGAVTVGLALLQKKSAPGWGLETWWSITLLLVLAGVPLGVYYLATLPLVEAVVAGGIGGILGFAFLRFGWRTSRF